MPQWLFDVRENTNKIIHKNITNRKHAFEIAYTQTHNTAVCVSRLLPFPPNHIHEYFSWKGFISYFFCARCRERCTKNETNASWNMYSTCECEERESEEWRREQKHRDTSLCYVRRFGEWHMCRCDAVDGRLLRVSNMLLVQIVEWARTRFH